MMDGSSREPKKPEAYIEEIVNAMKKLLQYR